MNSRLNRVMDTLGKMALVVGTAALLIFINVPFDHTKEDVLEIPHKTVTVKDANAERGTSEVLRNGVPGRKIVTSEAKYSFLQRMVSNDENIGWTQKKEVIEKQPVNEKVSRGTLSYQYMMCSDGSSRYYTDDQFKDPEIGFVHADEDYCAKNGQGTSVQLTNSYLDYSNYVNRAPAPVEERPEPPEQFNQPRAVCRDGSTSNSVGRGTCSWHGGVDYYL